MLCYYVTGNGHPLRIYKEEYSIIVLDNLGIESWKMKFLQY